MSFWDRFRRREKPPTEVCGECGEPATDTGFCEACYDALSCSFCAKMRLEVANLVSGPQVYICGECVHLARDILVEREGDTRLGVTLEDMTSWLEAGVLSAGECESALRASIALAPMRPDLIGRLATEAMRRQHPSLAAKLLEKTAESDRDSLWARRLSQALFDAGDFDGSIRAIDSIEHDGVKDAMRAQVSRMTSLLAPARSVDDVEELTGADDVLDEDEDVASARFAQAMWLFRNGRATSANKLFEQVAERFEDRLSASFLVLWGECLAALDRPLEAGQKWRVVLESTPDRSYWKQRAQAHLDADKPYR